MPVYHGNNGVFKPFQLYTALRIRQKFTSFDIPFQS